MRLLEDFPFRVLGITYWPTARYDLQLALAFTFESEARQRSWYQSSKCGLSAFE